MKYTVIKHRMGELRCNIGKGAKSKQMLIDCCSPLREERGPYYDDESGAFVKRVYLTKAAARALKASIEDFLNGE